MNDLTEEDTKLIALAKQARARIQAIEGAAVRDDTGRSYSGATVELASIHLSALQLAIAQAVAAGARDIEAAVVITSTDDIPTEVVHDASTTPTPVYLCSPRGEVTASTTVEPRG
jgi:cytidine deaminase